MKNFYWVIFLLIFVSCKTTNIKTTLEVYSHNQNVLTIIPRNKNDVIKEGNYVKRTISEKEYNRLNVCINSGSEITIIKNTDLDLELEFINDSPIVYSKGQNEEWIKELDECDLNILHVILLHHDGELKEILIGEHLEIIKVNDKFFKLKQNNFYKLKNIIERYIVY